MGSEPLNSDLLCGLLDHRPYGPVAQPDALHLAALLDTTEQPTLLDLGGRHPGVDSLPGKERASAVSVMFATLRSQLV